MAPFIATGLVERYNSSVPVALYLLGACMVTAVAVLFLKETKVSPCETLTTPMLPERWPWAVPLRPSPQHKWAREWLLIQLGAGSGYWTHIRYRARWPSAARWSRAVLVDWAPPVPGRLQPRVPT